MQYKNQQVVFINEMKKLRQESATRFASITFLKIGARLQQDEQFFNV